MDDCMVKALAQESAGINLTSRRKMDTKRSVLTDERGLSLAVVLSGANTHDVKLRSDTLGSVIIFRPASSEDHPQNLCLDAGYISHQDEVVRIHNHHPCFKSDLPSKQGREAPHFSEKIVGDFVKNEFPSFVFSRDRDSESLFI